MSPWNPPCSKGESSNLDNDVPVSIWDTVDIH